MTVKALKTIVTRAVTSNKFRRGVISENRAELLKEYDLTADERAAVMGIVARTESEFYAQMGGIIEQFTLLEKGAKR